MSPMNLVAPRAPTLILLCSFSARLFAAPLIAHPLGISTGASSLFEVSSGSTQFRLSSGPGGTEPMSAEAGKGTPDSDLTSSAGTAGVQNGPKSGNGLVGSAAVPRLAKAPPTPAKLRLKRRERARPRTPVRQGRSRFIPTGLGWKQRRVVPTESIRRMVRFSTACVRLIPRRRTEHSRATVRPLRAEAALRSLPGLPRTQPADRVPRATRREKAPRIRPPPCHPWPRRVPLSRASRR